MTFCSVKIPALDTTSRPNTPNRYLGSMPSDSNDKPFPAPQLPSGRREHDKLVVDHLHLVEKIAGTIRCSLPSFVSIDDLIQAGTLGLIDAASKFSSDKQVPFLSYAKHR